MSLNVQSDEKPRVDEGTALTPKYRGDIPGCRSQTKASDAMLLFDGTYRKDITRPVTRNARQFN